MRGYRIVVISCLPKHRKTAYGQSYYDTTETFGRQLSPLPLKLFFSELKIPKVFSSFPFFISFLKFKFVPRFWNLEFISLPYSRLPKVEWVFSSHLKIFCCVFKISKGKHLHIVDIFACGFPLLNTFHGWECCSRYSMFQVKISCIQVELNEEMPYSTIISSTIVLCCRWWVRLLLMEYLLAGSWGISDSGSCFSKARWFNAAVTLIKWYYNWEVYLICFLSCFARLPSDFFSDVFIALFFSLC